MTSKISNSIQVSVMWDCKRENRLKIAYNNGNVNVLEFIWSVDHSGYSSSDDKSYISVIDNGNLQENRQIAVIRVSNLISNHWILFWSFQTRFLSRSFPLPWYLHQCRCGLWNLMILCCKSAIPCKPGKLFEVMFFKTWTPSASCLKRFLFFQNISSKVVVVCS